MLDKCIRDQWRVADIDWTVPPAPMARDKEEAVVQYFTDMAGIERLAGALFDVQRQKTEDPLLAKIFSTFVADEKRHAEVAEHLARHYDVHGYRTYAESPELTAFRPHFLHLVQQTAPEIANAYILAGELILDVALLRSIDDYVADETSHAVMHLVNRDESRHIALDFRMTEFYASDDYRAEIARRPAKTAAAWLAGARALVTMMWHAKPFLRAVFLTPMEKVDPSGVRLAEAIKRIQLVLRKPKVRDLPFSRFMIEAQDAYNRPVVGRLFGPLLLRALGAEPALARRLFTEAELARSQRMSFDELAEDALAAKLA